DGVLHTDPARFRQVLYNLLSNAIKYTPAPGKVAVRWGWVDAAAREAAPVPEGQATGVRVSVADTGIGIAPEDQEAVWDEFRQLKTGYTGSLQGTGLGLALTRRLGRLLGGRIWLESAVGRGSTFTFVLPRVLPGRGAAAGAAVPPPEGRRALALVIEDYPPTHKLLTDWLDEAGLATASAYDGEEGLAEARRLRPQLIVLDLRLPKLDGWQLLTELKSDPATASIPVVVVTISEDRQLTSGLGVQEYFIKPVDRDDFLRRLRQLQPALFQQGRPLHALVAEDDPGTRKLLADMLQAEGAVVS